MKELEELEKLKGFILQYIKGLGFKYHVFVEGIRPTNKNFDTEISYALEIPSFNKHKELGIQWGYFNKMIYTQTDFKNYKDYN